MIILGQQTSGGSDLAGIILMLIWLAVIVAVFVGLWKTYAKAGQPGWSALIPIYNLYIWTKIVGRPWWWLILLFIPIVSIVIAIILCIDLAKSFGKGIGFGIGLILLGFIFIPILGFGSAKYLGPSVGR